MTCGCGSYGMRAVAAFIALAVAGQTPAVAQPAPESEQTRIQQKLAEVGTALTTLREREESLADQPRRRSRPQALPDIAVYLKAADWITRHQEFYKPSYVGHTHKALDTAAERIKLWSALIEKSESPPPWETRAGTTIRGYISAVDGSVQPYALTLPEGVDPQDGKRWPLHVKLHGRGGTLNEISFIAAHDNKPLPKDQNWIQLDVFGRVNNAYRWSGETDVFEAIDDVKRRFRIDYGRITLWGFSMGGAGAWHLGLHHPTQWSSVGPGAGFVDFYKYQNQSEKRPAWQHSTLGIYDSLDYAMNAFNVPICTYGGEKDKQLQASTRMVEAAKKLDIDIKLVIGKGAGHKFTPEGFREFMDFHLEKSAKGRPRFGGPRQIRFTTRTLKYNECGWLTIEEMLEQYEPATVEGGIDDDGVLRLTTKNVAMLQIARDVALDVEIDGSRLPLSNAADGLLPGVYFDKGAREWYVLDYDTSKNFPANADGRKRHDMQGPIDDAFMSSFVCVKGTGSPWSTTHQQWADWTLARFDREFDKWLRGKIRVLDDQQVIEETIRDHNLILFGDPGSNSVLKRVLDSIPDEKRPVSWSKDALQVAGTTYDPETHGLAMIFPNPLNPRRYIVINSGHTFHEKDFKASNSWLFPRLGDIAVQKFSPKAADSDAKGGPNFEETTVWADIFNGGWRLPQAAGK